MSAAPLEVIEPIDVREFLREDAPIRAHIIETVTPWSKAPKQYPPVALCGEPVIGDTSVPAGAEICPLCVRIRDEILAARSQL